jgi:hypothetical protein
MSHTTRRTRTTRHTASASAKRERVERLQASALRIVAILPEHSDVSGMRYFHVHYADGTSELAHLRDTTSDERVAHIMQKDAESIAYPLQRELSARTLAVMEDMDA